MTSNHITAAAEDFGRHTKGGVGWALGLEVASCVKRARAGRRVESIVPAGTISSEKVSAQEFARLSGTSAARVLRYLDAWERAAEQGIVPSSDELCSEDWNDAECIPEGYEWGDYYDAGEHNGGSRISKDPERAIAQVIQEHGVEAIAAAVRQPEVARAVRNDFEASTAILRESAAEMPRAAPAVGAGGGGGPTPRGRDDDTVDGMTVSIIVTLAERFAVDADELLREVVKATGDYVWRPKQQQAVLTSIENGINRANAARAVMEGVDDTALNDLLNAEERGGN